MDETQPQRRSRRAAALACKEKLRKGAAPSRQTHAVDYESAASQQGLLFDLPQGVIERILHMAGPHSRQACKALAHLYGPLLSLTPRGLARILDLAALRRHRHLRALDLQYVTALLTDNSIKGLCKALPHLQELRTGTEHTHPCSINTPGLATALAMLPSLTSLHLPSFSGIDYAALDAISALTALRELTLPTPLLPAPAEDLANLSACTQLSKLAFQDPLYNWNWVNLASVVSCAQALPALVSLTLDAHEIDAPPAQLQELQRLTQLTALRLWGLSSSEAMPMATGQTLQMVGAMANLRSLDVKLLERAQWTVAERGWLSRLSLLTCLSVRFTFDSEDDDDDGDGSGAFDEVVSAVPLLPMLRELRLASGCEDPLGDMDDFVTDAPFARLASASTSLEALELRQLNLSRNYMEAVQQLTGLTSLGFRRCDGMSTFEGLTALTALRELTYDLLDEFTLDTENLEGLSNLHTLALRGNFMDRPYLTRLVAALPQLRVLDISTNANIGSGVSALKRLSSLEVLDLSDTVEAGVLVRHLKVPRSLRQCFVGAWLQQEERQRVRKVLGTGVEVREDRWQQEEWVRLH